MAATRDCRRLTAVIAAVGTRATVEVLSPGGASDLDVGCYKALLCGRPASCVLYWQPFLQLTRPMLMSWGLDVVSISEAERTFDRGLTWPCVGRVVANGGFGN